jgi:hypothetical protein
MLNWMKQLPVPGVPDVVAFADDPNAFIYYVLPKAPTYRLDANGLPVFKFLKYRTPIDRPDNRKGGGFLICDVAFALTSQQLDACRAALQALSDAAFPRLNPKPTIEIRNVGFTRAACSVQLLDGNGPNAVLVETIANPAAPALYGGMVTPITVELSPEGATLLEEALQDKGGVVQIAYDLFAPVKLPPMTVTVWFHASKFMEFQQQVTIDWSLYGDDSYRETIHERFVQSDAGGVLVDPGGVTDSKIVNAVRDWGFQQLDDAVKRMILGDIAPVSEDARKVPDGIEKVWRDMSVSKVADFRRVYTQGTVIEVNIGPRGTLPNITSTNGPDGRPLKWADFARVVDLDDPFFKRVSVNYRANVDFAAMPVKSVDVTLRYGSAQPRGASFVTPDDVGRQEWALDAGNWKYKYQYVVNYRNETRRLESAEVETDSPVLTINVGDAGILHADVQVGDMNFDQVAQALVTVSYEDAANGVARQEWSFTLDADNREHGITKPIFAARTQPFTYRVKYTLKDGREFTGAEARTMASQIFVGDPFQANRTVSVRSTGNLETDIATIFVDLTYRDEKNAYTQTTSVALSKSQKFFDWTFPVVDETGGTLTYGETIQFADGTQRKNPDQVATKNTILVGSAPDDEFLTIDVLPDLLDFAALKLVKVTLHYQDPANQIDVTKDCVFKAGAAAQQFKVRIADRTKRAYEYAIDYFRTDGTKASVGPTASSDTTLVVDAPAA